MSATKNMPVTHDIGLRISWNNRPVLSIRPEVSDAKMGLPGKDVDWKERRRNMQDVCMNCHNENWVKNFYIQYDGLITLYNDKYGKPGSALYALAVPLLNPVKFSNKLDFVWFEIWHHEGRRARHGASMMGPDYTHWHGTYDLAKNFYSEYIPELEELAHESKEEARHDQAETEKKLAQIDPKTKDEAQLEAKAGLETALAQAKDKIIAAEKLEAEIEKVLHSDDHKWYLGQMDPEEAERRAAEAKAFQERYK
jgi:hydroxylamine dehydrogenase